MGCSGRLGSSGLWERLLQCQRCQHESLLLLPIGWESSGRCAGAGLATGSELLAHGAYSLKAKSQPFRRSQIQALSVAFG